MKKILIIVVLMMSIFANAQFKRFTIARITLNDGTVKNGLAKIRDLQLDVKFKANKEAKKEFFDFKEIKSISIVEMGDVVNYEVKYKTKKTTPIANNANDEYDYVRMPYLFEVVVKGKVSLYSIQTASPAMMGSNGMMMGGGGTSTTYYLSRDNNRFVTNITYFRGSFKKRAIKYFSDCPDLVQKIKDKVFRKRDIEEIVKYYNSNCGK